MSKQIYQASDIKGRVTPLSSSGYTDELGVFHSPEEVTKNKINSSDAALYYNQLTNEEIKKLKQSKGLTNEDPILSGFGKEILAIEKNNDPNTPNFGGWQGQDKNPLQPYTQAHGGGAKTHSEYALWTRLVGNQITITTPDGKTTTKPINEVFNINEYNI